ncbi:MAG: hypothetical protein ACD_39C00544G0002 [uncultured bacterium]|nr:MAG: hypothetical protein ACD_39C00544G0002 [uncultured bacterium]
MKSKYLLLSVTVLMCIILPLIGLTGCGAGAGSSSALAKISDFTGAVTVNAVAAVKDQQLKENDVVEVGKDSMATISYLHDNSRVNLFYSEKNSGNSKLIIKPLKNDGKTFVVNLVGGLMTFFVPPVENRSSNFEITTDEVVVSIYQTMGRVENTTAEISVALVRGKVGISMAASKLSVEANQQWVYNKGTRAAPEIKPYDPANAADDKLYSLDKESLKTDINLEGRQ